MVPALPAAGRARRADGRLAVLRGRRHVNGEVFNVSGSTVNRWTSIEIQRSLVKGATKDPWTLDELDASVPTGLMAGA